MDFSTLAGSLARAGLPALSLLLGAVVPPPFDLMVKPAFAAISWAMGIDPATPDAVTQVQTKVDADPTAAAAKLQAVEDAHKDAAAAAQAELDARLKDVQDARATETQVMAGPAPLWIKATYPALAAIVIIGFVILLGLVMTHSVDTNNAIVMFGVTTFGGGFLQILNYYYGSSQGSADKTTALAALASQPQVIQGPGSHVSGGIAPAKRTR